MPFKKGHKGFKPKGAKSEKTKQWEALGQLITEDATEKVMQYLNDLWRKDKEAYFKAYKDLIEYFKPKLARTEHTGNKDAPVEHRTTIQVMNDNHEKRLKELEDRLNSREG